MLSVVRNILMIRGLVLLGFDNEAVLKSKYFARKEEENEEGKMWGKLLC
jgi:hypothetical protein